MSQLQTHLPLRRPLLPPRRLPPDLETYSHRGARMVMIAMLLADDVINDAEVKIIQQIYYGLTGQSLPEEELRHQIAGRP